MFAKLAAIAAGRECDIELLWGTRCSSEISVSAGAYKSNVQCREMEYHDFIFMPSRRLRRARSPWIHKIWTCNKTALNWMPPPPLLLLPLQANIVQSEMHALHYF